ncbi:MAG: ABC transporter ATP-binding protein [Deltaproteobacteria bacterium]|nr:ABC transporter ATP-binding protein [Deltaproteobacteria bacterium]
MAIEIRGLVKRYGDLAAVDGIDLDVAAGECFGLLGPNGAGKTTAVEIMEGLRPADAGTVRILGTTWGRGSRRLRQRIGIALQETQLVDRLTVRETLRLFRSFHREGRDVDAVLSEVELTEKAGTWVVRLSGGQRQRLALACALVGAPELLFLDEPTTGLDPGSRRGIWGLVEAFRRQGGTVLLTTHYMEEAERLCQRIAIMDRGRILTAGAPAELVRSVAVAHPDLPSPTLEDLFLLATGRVLRERDAV